MKPIVFSVREINQMAGGSSYIVGHMAEVELTSDLGIEISVESTQPVGVDADFVKFAIGHTRGGFAIILEPLSLGAKVRLSQLLLHEVDYKRSKQEVYSARGLAEALLQHVGREHAVEKFLMDIEDAEATGVYAGTLEDLAAGLSATI